MLVAAAMVHACGRTPASTAVARSASFTPVLSVRELMEHVIDPTADSIFDSAVIDVSEKGIVETLPLTDDDWLKVERGAIYLAESSNLLKMERRVAPPGAPPPPPLADGTPSPELAPEKIQALIDRDRARWDTYADELRVAAVNSLEVIRKRDTTQLFRIGGEIYDACENCHRVYWYPGPEAEAAAAP
jgi:hypothetical protein